MIRNDKEKLIMAARLGQLRARPILEKQFADRVRAYESNPRLCEFCKAALPYSKRKNKFCNHSCSAKFFNISGVFKTELLGRCRMCNAKIGSKLKFCVDCRNLKKNTLELAKSDKLKKAILLKERGHLCEVCKRTQWMNKPIPIELDHIDGNSDNNTRENLRLICPNCHAQTSTYTGKNVGKCGSRGIKRRNKKRLKQLQKFVTEPQ